jgi:hypothetical protein
VAVRVPPSLPGTLVVFLLCGPLFLFWSLLMASPSLLADKFTGNATPDMLELVGNALLSLLIGAVAWLSTLAVAPQGWTVTLLPTIAAAVLYWVAATQLVVRGVLRTTSRLRTLFISVLIACVVSALAFALSFALGSAMASPSRTAFRADLMLIVAVDAALVGLVLGALWRKHTDA